ncbi:hypothetical protein AB0B92_32885 [Streptomyces hygroscopicus]|uniref:hypothetical protein n=1 Tax=Streptomyces hygroscopicus TaxID=1912 RepID=UPI003400153A
MSEAQGETAGHRAPTAPADRTGTGHTLNTLMWAVLIPVVATAAGFLAQYPYGMLWLGGVIVLGAAAAAAVVAGGIWHRAGAATLAACATVALALFAGPALYELYVKRAGDRVDALVADTGKRTNHKGTELDVCRVVDTSGKVRDLSEQQNCHGQFTPKQHVVLFVDPLDALDPWVEATDERAVDGAGLGITAGLFAVTGSALLYAGLRRRPGR